MAKKRAMSSERARDVRRKGHDDAREFAVLLGIGKEYKTDPCIKEEEIDRLSAELWGLDNSELAEIKKSLEKGKAIL